MGWLNVCRTMGSVTASLMCAHTIARLVKRDIITLTTGTTLAAKAASVISEALWAA